MSWVQAKKGDLNARRDGFSNCIFFVARMALYTGSDKVSLAPMWCGNDTGRGQRGLRLILALLLIPEYVLKVQSGRVNKCLGFFESSVWSSVH